VRCPSQYTNNMLRREVVKYLADNWEWALPQVKGLLTANYGVPHEEGEDLGPFSFVSYLRKLLDPGFYGDSIVLYTISWMWGAKITILHLPHMSESRIRHNLDLGKVEIVVLLTNQHFSAVGKFSKQQNVSLNILFDNLCISEKQNLSQNILLDNLHFRTENSKCFSFLFFREEPTEPAAGTTNAACGGLSTFQSGPGGP